MTILDNINILFDSSITDGEIGINPLAFEISFSTINEPRSIISLHKALINGSNYEIIKLLIDKGQVLTLNTITNSHLFRLLQLRKAIMK